MNSDPNIFLSIIIPTYNSTISLNRTLSGLLNQSFKSFEILIMDGVSSDDTLLIAKSFNDNRIRIYSEPDSGIYDAMNKGIDRAQGEWVLFLGSDDELYDDNVLRNLFSEIELSTYDIVYGQVWQIENKRFYLGEFDAQKLMFRNISHQAIVYRRSVFSVVGKFDLKYKIAADYIHNLKWFFHKELTHKYIDLVISKFSQQGVSSNFRDDAMQSDFPLSVRLYGGWWVYFRYFILGFHYHTYLLVVKKSVWKMFLFFKLNKHV